MAASLLHVTWMRNRPPAARKGADDGCLHAEVTMHIIGAGSCSGFCGAGLGSLGCARRCTHIAWHVSCSTFSCPHYARSCKAWYPACAMCWSLHSSFLCYSRGPAGPPPCCTERALLFCFLISAAASCLAVLFPFGCTSLHNNAKALVAPTAGLPRSD
jgi:hypothetical protein